MRSEIAMALLQPPVVLPALMSVGPRLVSDISGPRALMLVLMVVLGVRLLVHMENAGPAPRSSVHEGDGHDGSPCPSAER